LKFKSKVKRGDGVMNLLTVITPLLNLKFNVLIIWIILIWWDLKINELKFEN
jgi:hypothetical protein